MCQVRQERTCWDGNHIDYRVTKRGGLWVPRSSEHKVAISGDQLQIAGHKFRFIDFGMMRRGQWVPLLRATPEVKASVRQISSLADDPLHYQADIRGTLAAGVKYHAWINSKGSGKELRFSPLVQSEWFSRLSDADSFGFRYAVDGLQGRGPTLSINGFTARQPHMWVERRGGQADGEYLADGSHLYALFARQHLDRLLPGEWVVDPAITQETIEQTSDDGYDRDDSNTMATTCYGNRVYQGDYGGADMFSGWRFQTVPVPQGSTMNSAYFRAYRLTANNTPPSVTFDGDDQDSAPAWGSGTTAERPRGANYTATTATATWNSFGTGNNQYVPAGSGLDITSIVEEIVGRAGWTTTNNMRFRAGNEASATNNWITFEDYEAAGTNTATLDADYVAAASGYGTADIAWIGA